MTRDQLLEKSLGDLREIAKLQGVKSITKYRKGELVDIIMNGGSKLSAVKPKAEAEEQAEAVSAPSMPQRTEEAPAARSAQRGLPTCPRTFSELYPVGSRGAMSATQPSEPGRR